MTEPMSPHEPEPIVAGAPARTPSRRPILMQIRRTDGSGYTIVGVITDGVPSEGMPQLEVLGDTAAPSARSMRRASTRSSSSAPTTSILRRCDGSVMP